MLKVYNETIVCEYLILALLFEHQKSLRGDKLGDYIQPCMLYPNSEISIIMHYTKHLYSTVVYAVW